MTQNTDINWEERRFYAATHILGGMCANYHHSLAPSPFWVKQSVILADYLLKLLSDPSGGTICPDLYQRDGKGQ